MQSLLFRVKQDCFECLNVFYWEMLLCFSGFVQRTGWTNNCCKQFICTYSSFLSALWKVTLGRVTRRLFSSFFCCPVSFLLAHSGFCQLLIKAENRKLEKMGWNPLTWLLIFLSVIWSKDIKGKYYGGKRIIISVLENIYLAIWSHY